MIFQYYLSRISIYFKLDLTTSTVAHRRGENIIHDTNRCIGSRGEIEADLVKPI
jgi:hypothetical protein